nr:dTDP-4-amino-4,6-dideoxygalactose transaminase [uncultured Pedobacter sp.]
MIKFNKPTVLGTETNYIQEAFANGHLCGDGPFTLSCNSLLEQMTLSQKVLITTSCTHAIEMASILAEISVGDEVIMPSYTFVSTANPFVLRGAVVKFVDIDPLTMNIDADRIEEAITSKTRAIVPVHYAGVSCDMDKIMGIADSAKLNVIEDAAQGVMASYKGIPLGSIGDLGAFSFHETKNYHCGEGGALLINNENFIERAEIIREKGTNRKRFLRGQVDKYSWVDVGSSYLPSEMNAAFLYAQLQARDLIYEERMRIWNRYFNELIDLRDNELLELPYIPDNVIHNAHMFYIKLKNAEERSALISFGKEHGVLMVFHYVPLHSAEAGHKFGEFVGEDKFTTIESERLLRLPLYYSLSEDEQSKVIEIIRAFFKNR